MVHALQDYNMIVNVYDPVADQNAALKEYGLSVEQKPQEGYFDAIIIAVAHRVFIDLGIDAIRRFGKSTSLIFDVKSVFPKHATDERL